MDDNPASPNPPRGRRRRLRAAPPTVENYHPPHQNGANGGLLIDPEILFQALKPVIEMNCADADPEELDIIFDNVQMALLEAQDSRRIRGEFAKRAPAPKRELSADEVEAIKARGREFPWARKGETDYRSPMEWVIDFYGQWLDGLTTKHIAMADPDLYSPFMKHVARKGFPPGVDIPTGPGNRGRQGLRTSAQHNRPSS